MVIRWLPLFLLVVSGIQFSTAAFAETPSQIISLPRIPNEFAVFRCRHMSLLATVGWRVNGSPLGLFPTILTESINDNGVRVDTLKILATLEFNGTEVICQATFDESPMETTEPVMLIIMTEQLEKVADFVRNGNNLSWTPPFSPDLTGVDPDIAYCVEVYNITCGSRDLIVGDCNVTGSSYTSDEIAPDGYIYEYTVTPRSNVDGARNGTSETVEDNLIQFNESTMGQRLVFQMRDNLLMATIFLGTEIESGRKTSVIPASYSTTLTSLDGLGNSERFLTTTTGNSDGSVTVVLSSLPFRRVWNAAFLAYGCAQHSQVGNDIEIGTHDIYNISVVSLSGIVTVTGDIISGSMSSGILIIAYSLTDETNTHYNLTTFLPDQLRVNTMLMDLPSGQYQVSVFVIEENGLPFSRAAATPRRVQSNGQRQLASPKIKHEIIVQDSFGVCVNCTFLTRSTTHCMVVVHQKISQLSSSGLMSIKSSHILNRTDNTAYGCIEGVNLTDYQVGVFGIRFQEGENEGSAPQLAFIAGIIVAVVLLVVLVVVMVLVIAVIVIHRAPCSKKKVKPTNEATDPVYAHTVHFGSRHETLKEKEAENDYVMEYDTIQSGRIKPTNEDRLVSEYDVAQPERREQHTQDDRNVNEYDVVARDESEHTKEETEQYDDIIAQGGGKSKQDNYAEVGATPSERLMVKLDDDKVIYSDVQSPEVEQESQEGADNPVTVVRSSADSESLAGHDVEPAMVVKSETVNAFSSDQSSADVSELVTLMDGENYVSNEIFDGVKDCYFTFNTAQQADREVDTHSEVNVSQCDPNGWQNKDLILPCYEKATHQFQHIGQTMQLHHRRLCRNTGQE